MVDWMAMNVVCGIIFMVLLNHLNCKAPTLGVGHGRAMFYQ